MSGFLVRSLFGLLILTYSSFSSRAQSIYSTPYVLTTFAGSGANGTNDGFANTARFNLPEGMAVDGNGNVYVADQGNHAIRKISPAGEVMTFAGLGGQRGTNDGLGSEARFSQPTGVAVDSSNYLYVADSQNQTVRKITPAGVVSTLAGKAGVGGNATGTGSAARFNRPYGLAVDAAANVYVADSNNHKIRKITPDGVVSTWAGSGSPGTNDGPALSARFTNPQGVAVDSATNVYVGDRGNNTIRKISPTGIVTTLAGLGGQSGNNDGVGSFARFQWPNGLAVDHAGNVFVVDQLNNTIRKITPSGSVTTLAGKAGVGGLANGVGGTARLSFPSGLALDVAGNIFVGDMDSNRIRRGSPALLFLNYPGDSGTSNGVFFTRLVWPFPTNVVVESSVDLTNWTPLLTNAILSDELALSLCITNPAAFYRAKLVP